MSDVDLTRASQLRRIPMFSCLDEVGLLHVSNIATEVTVPPGHVLLQPGQEGAGLFVILEGEVNVELGATTIACVPGEFIGEMSLLVDGLVHTGRVRAATEVTCLAISRGGEFGILLDDYPQIAVSMLKVLAQRLAVADEMLTTG